MASEDVKVYTVNGAAAGSSSSLPDWLTRKRAASGKGKRAVREHVEGTLELIQGFEFPEASNKVKSSRDGTHVIATGTYKPQIRVWDLGQLSLKFERHTDAENIDFVVRELLVESSSRSFVHRYLRCSLTTGQSQYTFKTIVLSSYTLKAVITTEREYPALVDHLHTTFPLAMPSSLLLVMKYIVSTLTKDAS